LVHPVLIFLTYTLIFYLILFYSNLNNKKLFNQIYSIKKNKSEIKLGVVISVNAIFLGSWWANQELGWGGWWSWDMVELINLIMTWTFLLKIHKRGSLFFDLPKKSVFLWFIFFHLSVRYDLFNSIHSFSNVYLLEYDSFFIYYLILYYLITYKIKISKNLNDAYLSFWIIILCGFFFKLIFYQLDGLESKLIITCLITIFSLNLWKNLKVNYTWLVSLISIFLKLVFNLFMIFNEKISLRTIIHYFIFLSFVLTLIFNNNDYFNAVSNKSFGFLINIDDCLVIFNKNIKEMFMTNNILIEKKLNQINNIPFYNYVNFEFFLLTTNELNFSLLNWYYSTYFYTLFFINIYFFKNINSTNINKYKNWCI